MFVNNSLSHLLRQLSSQLTVAHVQCGTHHDTKKAARVCLFPHWLSCGVPRAQTKKKKIIYGKVPLKRQNIVWLHFELSITRVVHILSDKHTLGTT